MAGRIGGEKTRCSGAWTEAKYRSFIKGNLRRLTQKWAPIQQCKKNARVSRGLYKCAGCGQEVPASLVVEGSRRRSNNVHVDHINPVVPTSGWTNWDDCIERMFCELSGLQALCSKCHSEVTSGENEERKEKRGFYKTHPSEYTCYVSMKDRCHNPNSNSYPHYGGRGITVCTRWRDSFLDFYEDIGARPTGTTLDRVDGSKGYSPDNCKWSTFKEQANNTYTNVLIEWEDKTLTLQQWSELTGINRATIKYRMSNGWSVGEALGVEDRPSKPEIKNRLKQEKLDAE